MTEETLDEINKMNAKLIYEKGLKDGKSQATKEQKKKFLFCGYCNKEIDFKKGAFQCGEINNKIASWCSKDCFNKYYKIGGFLDTKIDYDKGFLAGKSQATKEILKKELKFCQRLWDMSVKQSCDGWVLILSENRMEDIKQQLKKLGETL